MKKQQKIDEYVKKYAEQNGVTEEQAKQSATVQNVIKFYEEQPEPIEVETKQIINVSCGGSC